MLPSSPTATIRTTAHWNRCNYSRRPAGDLNVPKGDILHQFREDVRTGKLADGVVGSLRRRTSPIIRSSPWYGAWYVSEVMDILTKNPEVWKKTIFILTYDENDGYFDHVSVLRRGRSEAT